MQSITTDEGFNGFDATSAGDDDSPRLMDIDIAPPITVDGKTYDVVHLQEPTADQWRAAQAAATPGPTYDTDLNIHLIANVSKVPRQVIGKLPMSQVLKGGFFLRDCVESGLRTTPT